MKSKGFLIFVLSGISSIILAQGDTTQYFNKTLSKNNFSIELGGKAYLYSVGYERTIYNSRKIMLTSSINLSYEPFAGFDGIIVPVGINTFVGKKQNKLLLGLYLTSGFAFHPYPKTRKEREAYRTSGQYKYDMYRPPYSLFYIVPSVGYRRYLKKGNSISIEYTHLIYNFYGELFFAEPGLVPWFGITYNFRF